MFWVPHGDTGPFLVDVLHPQQPLGGPLLSSLPEPFMRKPGTWGSQDLRDRAGSVLHRKDLLYTMGSTLPCWDKGGTALVSMPPSVPWTTVPELLPADTVSIRLNQAREQIPWHPTDSPSPWQCPNQKRLVCERLWWKNEKTSHILREIFTEYMCNTRLVSKTCKEFF